jgi:hypothetical protein
VRCPTPAPPLVWQASLRAVPQPPERLQRLAHARHAQVTSWRLPPVVDALQAWRGVQGLVAVTTGAARGARPRGAPPRARMRCLGLLPSADSRGARRRQGALTTAGQPHARRARIAGAWAARDPAQGRRHLHLRLATPANVSQDIGGKAPGRRWTRDRHLIARGQQATPGVVARARAGGGLMGAMATQVPVPPDG